MATTVANVPVAGRPSTIVGALRETITDVTVATNSETVTAAQLGLNAIQSVHAEIQAGQSSDTAIYATGVISAGSNSVVLATFAAAGTAATTSATTVLRVRARGY